MSGKGFGELKKAVLNVPEGDLEALGVASGIPLDERVYAFDSGKAAVITAAEARRSGLVVVDLSDDYAPFIFSERAPGRNDYKPNEYRRRYVGVANDRSDEVGSPLGKDQHNYVELFGIPPSLGVLRRRFLSDAAGTCYQQLNMNILRRYRGVIRYTGQKNSGRFLKRYKELRRAVVRAKKATRVKDIAQLARHGKYRWLVKQYRIAVVRVAIINQAQLRLRCEGLLARDERFRRRHMDYVTHKALARFERKHMIFGWGQLYGKTVRTLGRPPEVNNHAALLRVLRERVANAAGIIEDGSVNRSKRIKAGFQVDGKTRKVPNLIERFTAHLTEAMGLETPDKAQAFFERHRAEFFRQFRVAVRFPELPPYYASRMKFLVEIDRGDIWYDYPYDAAGNRARQARSRMPHLTLYTFWKDQKIPLVRWPTTIGGWRKEFKDGKVYLKYKNSDVGLRFWRDIVAGPVWIPPESTPPEGLVKRKKKKGKWTYRVNRSEIGPGYLSAYGLVASYHIEQLGTGRRAGWRDNGIRTHGSVDYMSIYGRFSHGCHRVHNHLAVRLFSFILRHSRYKRRGQIPLRYGRTFRYRRRTFKILLHTRGYYYTLRTPVVVEVLEGRIRGKVRQPIEGYMRVPGVKYAEDDPNLSGRLQDSEKGVGWAPNDGLPPDVPPADTQPIHPASPKLPKDTRSSINPVRRPRDSKARRPVARPRAGRVGAGASRRSGPRKRPPGAARPGRP